VHVCEQKRTDMKQERHIDEFREDWRENAW